MGLIKTRKQKSMFVCSTSTKMIWS